MFEPRAADLDLVDVETALLRGAVGDYADEAAVLLLINFGHWLPQLQSADLITLAPDLEDEGWWAQIAWPDLEPALAAGSHDHREVNHGQDGTPLAGDPVTAVDRLALRD